MSIQTEVAQPRHPRGTVNYQKPQTPPRNEDPGNAPQNGKENTFRQKLAYDPTAPCSKCSTDGDLYTARGGTGQQQARDIGAGDQKHETDGSLQNQKRFAYPSEIGVGEGLDQNSPAGVASRIFFGALGSDGFHF